MVAILSVWALATACSPSKPVADSDFGQPSIRALPTDAATSSSGVSVGSVGNGGFASAVPTEVSSTYTSNAGRQFYPAGHYRYRLTRFRGEYRPTTNVIYHVASVRKDSAGIHLRDEETDDSDTRRRELLLTPKEVLWLSSELVSKSGEVLDRCVFDHPIRLLILPPTPGSSWSDTSRCAPDVVVSFEGRIVDPRGARVGRVEVPTISLDLRHTRTFAGGVIIIEYHRDLLSDQYLLVRDDVQTTAPGGQVGHSISELLSLQSE